MFLGIFIEEKKHTGFAPNVARSDKALRTDRSACKFISVPEGTWIPSIEESTLMVKPLIFLK